MSKLKRSSVFEDKQSAPTSSADPLTESRHTFSVDEQQTDGRGPDRNTRVFGTTGIFRVASRTVGKKTDGRRSEHAVHYRRPAVMNSSTSKSIQA